MLQIQLSEHDNLMANNISEAVRELGYSEVAHRLAVDLAKKKQEPCSIFHRFRNGVYVREIIMPAGALCVGHKHKMPYMNQMLAGKILVLKNDGSWVELDAPFTGEGEMERKVGIVMETVVWQNIIATDETDPAKIEDMFIDKDEEERVAIEADNTYDVDMDRLDYADVCAQLGFTPDEVKEMSQSEVDMIPFPNGDYKFQRGPSPIDGQGLFATAPIEAGEIVCPARLDFHRTPAGRFINHSLTPNVEMVMDSTGDVYVVALRDIHGNEGGRLGEELTTDYFKAFMDTRFNVEEMRKCLA